MKKIKYILIFILSVGIFNSCLVDDTAEIDSNDAGPNLASFENTSMSFGAVADGSLYEYFIPIKVNGPTYMDITSDISVTVGVDVANSTAEEGVHFSIPTKTVTLEADQNHLFKLPINIITEDITAPLSKKLVLEIVDASGDPSIVNNGKKLNITINYGCPSDLAGTYLDDNFNDVVTVEEIGVGLYRCSAVTYFVNDYPFDFTDVCGQLTVVGSYLTDNFGIAVTGSGTDNEDGTLTISLNVDGYVDGYVMNLTKL